VPHIHVVPPEAAEGDLKRQYDEAVRRAGKVWNIVAISSLNPGLSRAFMAFYASLMHGPSDLSRAEREMLATVVSWANACHY